MDKLEIKSTFMRNMLNKMVSKMIQKKFGYKIDIDLNDLDVSVTNGKAYVHLDVDLEVDNNELTKIVKSITTD